MKKLGWQHLAGTDINQLKSVIEWWHPGAIKVVATGSIDAGYLLQIAAVTPPETKLIYRVLYHEGFNSDMWEHWIGQFFGDPTTAAEVWIEMLEDAFAPLFALAKQRWVAIETFNEQGMNLAYSIFSREVAKRAFDRWGLHHVALNPSVGTYNEMDKWEGVARSGLLEELVRTDGRIGVHGYASWFIRSFHGNGWQYGDVLNFIRPNHTVNTLYEALEQQPYEWDGNYIPTYAAFGVWNAPIYLDALYAQLGKGNKAPQVKFHLTEFGLDNVGDPGIGKFAGGWKEWANQGAYESYLRPGSSPAHLYALQLAWAEKQLQKMPHIEAAEIFVYDASDFETDRWRNYRVDREIVPQIKAVWENDEPMPTPDNTCYVTTNLASVNVRTAPRIENATLFSPRKYIQQGQKLKALAKVTGANDSQWFKVLIDGVEGYVAGGQYSQLVGECGFLDAPEPTPDDVEALKKRVVQLEEALAIEKAKLPALEKEVAELKAWKLEAENHITTSKAHMANVMAELLKVVPNPT